MGAVSADSQPGTRSPPGTHVRGACAPQAGRAGASPKGVDAGAVRWLSVPMDGKHTDRPPGGPWLILAEGVLSRTAAEENLPDRDDGAEEADLELDIACSEIARHW